MLAKFFFEHTPNVVYQWNNVKGFRIVLAYNPANPNPINHQCAIQLYVDDTLGNPLETLANQVFELQNADTCRQDQQNQQNYAAHQNSVGTLIVQDREQNP
ncbi:MAG: hypothetical protein P1V97_27940, partial [Planctomycetota bacterium]|nr:hypothetical protein [Planctomycetota bacterium]